MKGQLDHPLLMLVYLLWRAKVLPIVKFIGPIFSKFKQLRTYTTQYKIPTKFGTLYLGTGFHNHEYLIYGDTKGTEIQISNAPPQSYLAIKIWGKKII